MMGKHEQDLPSCKTIGDIIRLTNASVIFQESGSRILKMNLFQSHVSWCLFHLDPTAGLQEDSQVPLGEEEKQSMMF